MLSVQERQAWYVLGVFALAAIAYLTVGCFTGFHPGALGTFGLVGFVGFESLIGRKELRAGKVVMDERDGQIARRAQLGAYGVFWLCFVVMCMAPFVAKGPHATLTIPTVVPPMVLFGGAAVVYTVRALITIVLCRR